MTRRRAANLALLAAVAALLVDAVAIEPSALEVTRHRVPARLARPIVIAHLSDLHARGFDRLSERVVAALEEARPDLIVLTGDLVDGGSLDPARELLSRLRARLGVFAVPGNWEHWSPVPNLRASLAQLGVRLLVDEAVPLGDGVVLAGFDDALGGQPRPERVLPLEGFRIAAFHSPVLFDGLAGRIDLALAGHTHAGQVRLPWIGALWRPPGSGVYDRGWVERAGSRMFISRGLGTSVARVRFLCRPELALITVGED